MKKLVFSGLLMSLAFVTVADDEYPTIRDTRKMRGSVTFVNAQKRVDVKEGVAKAMASLDKEFHWDLRMTNATEAVNTPASAAALRKSIKTTAAVFFVDKEDYPALSAFPDERVALVNVAPLLADKPDAKKISKRIRLETMRAFAFAFGAGFSQYEALLMSPADSLNELDIIPAKSFYPYDSLVALRKVAESRGMSPYTDEYYEVACQQGWAPAPTNAVQKKIWDLVHQMPTEPIKIEYNEKRDKGK